MVPVPQVSGVGVGFARGAGADGVGQNCKGTMHLLRNLNRFQLLKAVFSGSYSRNVAVLLASAYRDLSNRQAEVAWRALKAWLPREARYITKAWVLSFLAYLFGVRGFLPEQS